MIFLYPNTLLQIVFYKIKKDERLHLIFRHSLVVSLATNVAIY